MSSAYDQSLSVEEVLQRYHDGPRTGMFTDGGAQPNPGPGGWGVVYVKAGKIIEQRHGHDPDTTNNRMELRALIEGYKLLSAEEQLPVFTDSNLCVNTVNIWAKEWKRRGWKRKTGAIANLELVQELYDLHLAHPGVTLQWIKAHNGYRWNEYVDSLASAWTRERL